MKRSVVVLGVLFAAGVASGPPDNFGVGGTLAPGSAIANTPQPWDGATGGIVAFFADDTASAIGGTSIDGVISADNTGFQGVTTQADNGSTNCGSTVNLGVASGGSFRG